MLWKRSYEERHLTQGYADGSADRSSKFGRREGIMITFESYNYKDFIIILTWYDLLPV